MNPQLEHVTVKPSTTPITFYRRSAVALLIGVFAIGMDELIISPILLDISKSMHSPMSTAALAVSVYGLAIAISAPLVAPIGDRIGRRTLMLATLLLFLFATMVCVEAPNITVLLVARALLGVAAGAFVPSAYAYVGDNVPYEKRGRVMGIVMSGWAAALVIGVPAGAWVGGLLGWRMSFVIVGILAMISLVFITLLPKESRVGKEAVSIGVRHLVRTFCLAVQIPGVQTLLSITFCTMFGFYGAYTYLGSFLRSNYHFGSAAAGAFMLMYGIGLALSPVTGQITDLFGKRQSLLIALVVLSALLCVIPHLSHNIVLLVPALIVWGIGQSIALTTLSTLLTESSNEHRGQVMGLYSFFTNIAVALGSSLMGYVYNVYGYAFVGIVGGTVSFIGAILTFMSLSIFK